MKPNRSLWGWLRFLRSFRIHIPHDDRILPETRWVAIWITSFFLAGFVALTVWPEETASMFAWDINTRIATLVLGAACGAGFYFFSRVYLARQWHTISTGFLPIVTFSALALVATFLEWDSFDHDHASFVIWMVLIAIMPWLVFWVWIRNRSTDPRVPGVQEILLDRRAAGLLNALGIVFLGAALLLFIFPAGLAQFWPWNLESITGRILGGLCAGMGVLGLCIAADRRWTALRIVLETTAVFLALYLIGVIRAWNDLRPADPLTWIFLGGAILLLGLIVVYYFQIERRYRGKLPAQV